MRILINIPEEVEDKFIVISDMKRMRLEEAIIKMIKEYIEENENLLEKKEARKLLDG